MIRDENPAHTPSCKESAAFMLKLNQGAFGIKLMNKPPLIILLSLTLFGSLYPVHVKREAKFSSHKREADFTYWVAPKHPNASSTFDTTPQLVPSPRIITPKQQLWIKASNGARSDAKWRVRERNTTQTGVTCLYAPAMARLQCELGPWLFFPHPLTPPLLSILPQVNPPETARAAFPSAGVKTMEI